MKQIKTIAFITANSPNNFVLDWTDMA